MGTAAVRRVRGKRCLIGVAAVLALACTGANPAFRRGEPDARRPNDSLPAPDAAVPDVSVEQPGKDAEQPPGPDGDQPLSDSSPPTRDTGPDAAAADAATPDAGVEAGAGTGCSGDPALILCLRFEGQVTDQSPNHLPVSALSVQFTAGIDGMAAELSRQTRMEVHANPLLDADPVTIEAWIRPSVLPAGSARLGIVTYTREYSLFLLSNGDIECTAGTAEGDVSLRWAAGVRAGIWSSIGCRIAGGTLGAVVDGEERLSRSIAGLNPTGSTNTLVVGGNFPSANPDPFEGAVDNVRVWRARRSRTELCAGAGPLCRPFPGR